MGEITYRSFMGEFAESYLGRLRAVVGDRLLLVPGARIVIEDSGGRVLLQQRSDFGLWGLPGGNAEEGESLESVVVREVVEETGLTVSDVKPFGFGCDPAHETITFPNGDRCQFFALMFFTKSFVGVAAITDDESSALVWFDLGNLPTLLPNMARSLEAYRRFKTSGEFQMI
jgi:8-oxo-dGTP pyrophosphatase MutT (NUDIX family)